MSTFNGIVDEFPNIRIDHFRMPRSKDPPAACFLSHVHSDHLQGLETLRMPFVYCSSATRSLLLNMEKYPHRVNFAKGILEARKQTYKHLRFILRALPIRTAVELELSPKSRIQVTLFEANHCPGAVMFLIEGDGKAVLYTGDIRAEPWWVNSIVREPLLLPYVTGLMRLDCLYLDTTFASCEHIHLHFPTKAEGLQELLEKLSDIDTDSIIYFRAWTLGYEEVWTLMSNYLKSRIHVDSYQCRLFQAIAENEKSGGEIAALAGFQVGNQLQPGCLTTETTVRIHSCEPGTPCHSSLSKQSNVIWIIPIVSRLEDGTEVVELGAGGGGGDLYQIPKLEISDEVALAAFEGALVGILDDSSTRDQFAEAFRVAKRSGELSFDLDELNVNQEGDISIGDFAKRLLERHRKKKIPATQTNMAYMEARLAQQRVIHFPYSRHSSYLELRHFVSFLRPKDICPCTVDLYAWNENLSMQSLFGDLCSTDTFRFDGTARKEAAEVQEAQLHSPTWDSQSTELSFRQKDIGSSVPSKRPHPFEPDEIQDTRSRAGTKSKQLVDEPSTSRLTAASLSTRHEDQQKSLRGRLQAAWRGDQHGTDEYRPSFKTPTVDASARRDAIAEENSKSHELHVHSSVSDLPFCHDMVNLTTPAVTSDQISPRRLLALTAARKCLDQGDSVDWDHLHIRSTGWKGHSEEEMEL